ncbi:MAG TPA: YbhB/YbcL family Raf kinase inhibitor-like protein [Sphingomicrobium sp.]|nr:YbhB/YbcL family Raf kinase inhibitor-like protein [Sphingomicrobium sp.]
MWKISAPALLLASLAGCGAGDSPPGPTNGEATVDNATLTQFALTSGDIREGQPIPAVHSCDGADQSPALAWGEPPAGTSSFALVMDDPDAPSGTFRHWGAYNIPAGARSMPAGHPVGKQAINGFGKSGYGGPCPPTGHGPHHYRFKLYALDVEALDLPADASVEQLEDQAQKHQTGLATLTATFERK